MPTFEVELSDGRVVDIEGDKQPTEADVMQALGQHEQSQQPIPQAQQAEPTMTPSLNIPMRDTSVLMQGPDGLALLNAPPAPPDTSYFLPPSPAPQTPQEIMTQPVIPPPRVIRRPETVAEGIYNVMAKNLPSLISPVGAAIGPAMEAAGPLAPAITGALAMQGVTGLMQQPTVTRTETPTVGQRIERTGDILANVLMAAVPALPVIAQHAKILPRAAKAAAQTIIEKGIQDAIKERQVTESGQPEYIGTQAQRLPTETGGGYRAEPSPQVGQPKVPQTGQERVLLEHQIEEGEAILKEIEQPTYEQVIQSSIQQSTLPPKGTEAPPLSEQQLEGLRAKVKSAGPGQIGMGGATPKEFELSPDNPTSIKNATVDKEREQRGLPPAMQPGRKSFGTVWDRVMQRISDNPQSQDDLVNELRLRPRALTDEEDAMLLHRQIDLQNEYDKAAQRLIQSQADGYEQGVTEARASLAHWSDQLLDIYNIGKRSGTETGRGLNARKMMANEDFSLAKLELAKRAANDGLPLTDEQRSEIERIHRQYRERINELERYVNARDAKIAELEANRSINQIVREGSKRTRKTITPAEEKASIIQRIKEIVPENAGSEIGNLAQRLARVFVQEGITEREPLIDAVHEVLNELIPNHTRRDTMDAISGYGKYKQLSKDQIDVTLRDLKGQMQQIGKLEDMAAGEPPSKTGVERRTPSEEERRLIKQVNVEKKKGGYTVTDPGRQLRTALQAVKTRLENQISDLQHQIETRQKIVKEQRSIAYDEEANRLLEKRDSLKEQFDQIFGKPELTDAQRLQVWKTRTSRRIAELEDKLKRQNFTTKTRRPPPVFDEEALKLKSRVEDVRQEFQRGLVRDRLRQQPLAQRTMDRIAKWRRGFILSSPITLAKLTAAAIERMVFTPTEEVIGGAISKAFPELARRAQREGGLNSQAEAEALTKTFTEGMKDSWNTLRTGQSALDVAYGKQRLLEPTAIDFMGHLHGALKAPVKRNEFARSFRKRIQAAINSGIDTSDPLVQLRIAKDAFEDANRSIFMQNNIIVDAYKRGLSAFERGKGGQPPSLARKALGTTARVLLPIVKVPSNIVAESMEYAIGSGIGLVRLGRAYRRGIDKLSSEEADFIMRQLKKGSIGGAVMALGFLNPEMIGGYYQRGEKRQEKDVKWGSLRIYGTDIPSYLIHNPLLEMLQLGATIRRVADSKFRKSDTEPRGIGAGVLAGATGILEEMPFVREMLEISKAFNPREQGAFFGELAKSIAIPQVVQWAAQQTDKDAAGNVIQRKPKTTLQHVETGIPGLRQDVPTTTKSPMTY